MGSFDGSGFSTHRPAAPDEGWYFVRVELGDAVIAYSTPVWVSAAS